MTQFLELNVHSSNAITGKTLFNVARIVNVSTWISSCGDNETRLETDDGVYSVRETFDEVSAMIECSNTKEQVAGGK